MQEQELFQGYEVKNWDLNPRIYKILLISAIFNVLALLIVGQTNLLTTKGCDSPFVGRVCQVLDTVYVGGKILTTDRGYKDEAYDPTEIIDSSDITWVKVDDKLYYPEGYFTSYYTETNPAMVMDQNGEGTAPTDMNGFQNIPGFPNTTNPTITNGNDLSKITPNYPTRNNNPIKNLPKPPLSGGNTQITKRPKNVPLQNDSSNTLPSDKELAEKEKKENQTQPEPKKTPLKSDAVPEVPINKQPLNDLVKDILEDKKFDLNKQFSVTMEGTLFKDTDGYIKFDKKKSRFITEKETGDEAMRDIVKTAIKKFGDSGWLGYFHDQGVEKITFTVSQDGEFLKVVVTSDQPTPERAQTVSSGLSGAIKGALLADTNGWKKLGDDERLLLSKAEVTSKGNQFILNFALPKADAQRMIMNKLEEERKKLEEEKNKKPNSTAQIVETNKTSSE